MACARGAADFGFGAQVSFLPPPPPLGSAIQVGDRAHRMLPPYADATPIGAMPEGNDGAVLKEGTRRQSLVRCLRP